MNYKKQKLKGESIKRDIKEYFIIQNLECK